jgi:hypothetical protein
MKILTENFVSIDNCFQQDIFYEIIKNNKYSNIFNFVKCIVEMVNFYEYFNFEVNFINIINSISDTTTFNYFSGKLQEIIFNCPKNEYDFIIIRTNTYDISEKYRLYIDHIKSLNNNYYILLNKLQILECLYNNKPIEYYNSPLTREYDERIQKNKNLMTYQKHRFQQHLIGIAYKPLNKKRMK